MKKGYDTFGIAVSLIILVLFIAVFLVFIYSKTKNNNNNMNKIGITNTMNNKEQFADIVPLSSDELLEKLKLNPDGLQEVVALDNLTESIKDIINSKIEDLNKKDVMDDLPIGMIIMWNKEELPSTKWKWCNGENNTPNLKYRFPLGGKTYGGENDKPEGDNDGLIKKNNVPKHRHTLNGDRDDEKFPELKHNHGGSTSTSGNHSHTLTIYGDGGSGAGTKQGFEYDNAKGAVNYSNNKANDAGEHSHTLNTSLVDADNKIKTHKVGEGPIYGEGEEQKPFYPHYTLINFIMKVE